MSSEELEYLLGKIDVFIENNIKIRKGNSYVKQQKSSNKGKKIFSNKLNER